MEFLLYTVTYRTQEPNERYNGRVYEWQTVDGLQVPAKMTTYRWNTEEQAFGDKGSEATFANVTFRTGRPDPARFEMPEGGEIDPLPTSAE